MYNANRNAQWIPFDLRKVWNQANVRIVHTSALIGICLLHRFHDSINIAFLGVCTLLLYDTLCPSFTTRERGRKFWMLVMNIWMYKRVAVCHSGIVRTCIVWILRISKLRFQYTSNTFNKCKGIYVSCYCCTRWEKFSSNLLIFSFDLNKYT